MLKPALLFSVATFVLAACGHPAQTTSGKEYLARSQAVKSQAQPKVQRTIRHTERGAEIIEDRIDTVSTDDLIRHAAAIEPLLTLPARIGLARIENGHLTTIPAGEGAIWSEIAQRNAALGTFAPIDPFLAKYTLKAVLPQDSRALQRDAHDIITSIRLGAARQHMDAVLIYEIGARTHRLDGFEGLRIVRTLGAAPLPAQPIEKEGVARAFLMDVRNGYPYGTASASIDLKDLTRDFWDDGPADRQAIAAKTRITKALAPEVERVFASLVSQMQTRLAAAK